MKDYLQNWMFHFNPFTEKWAAIPRDLQMKYWDDYDLDGIIRSSKIETLLSILHKVKGDEDELKKFKDDL